MDKRKRRKNGDQDRNLEFRELFAALISQYQLSPDVAKIILERILVVMQDQHKGEKV